MILEHSRISKGFLFVVFCLSSFISIGQEWPRIYRITDSAEYVQMEPLVDSCISYLRNTSLSEDFTGRVEAYRFLSNWTAGVPYVVIHQADYLFEITNRNEELITQHLAGKLHYMRSHADIPEQSFESEWEGLNWLIDLYAQGGFPPSSDLEELIEKRNSGELEEWLERKLPSAWKRYTTK